MEQEIHNQVEDLPAFARELGKDDRFRNLDPSRIIFTGSGDSFACSLFAHYLSQMQAFSADPFELRLYPQVSRNKTVFITSISGKTRTNIQLARKVKVVAKKRVAITANSKSPLAKECDDVIQLRYRSLGILTSGTARFWGYRLNTSIQSSLGIPSFSHSKTKQTTFCSYRIVQTRRRVKCFEFFQRVVSTR